MLVMWMPDVIRLGEQLEFQFSLSSDGESVLAKGTIRTLCGYK